MPRNKNRGTILRVPFSSLEAGTVTLTTGFNLQTFALTPSLNARLTNIADNYALYRFTTLDFELMGPGPAGTSNAESVVQVLGYLPEVTDTAPTLATQVGNLQHSIVTGFHNQVGSESAPTPMRGIPPHLKLGREALIVETPNKWWKTVASSGTESWEEQQGTVYLATDSSGSTSSVIGYAFMLKGVIEFSGPVSTAQTPMADGVVAGRKRTPPETKSQGVICRRAGGGGS